MSFVLERAVRLVEAMEVAVESGGPPATLARMSNELPCLQIVQILLLREDPRPPPM